MASLAWTRVKANRYITFPAQSPYTANELVARHNNRTDMYAARISLVHNGPDFAGVSFIADIRVTIHVKNDDKDEPAWTAWAGCESELMESEKLTPFQTQVKELMGHPP